MDNIDVRAFAMPERYMVAGKKKVPVVVMVEQGASPAGNGDKEDALVPVGTGAASVDGDSNYDLGHGWNADSRPERKPDDKRFPVRMFHLVDVSGSMGCNAGLEDKSGCSTKTTKLELVQSTIARLADKIHGIKHILIPYDDSLYLTGDFAEAGKLVEAVQGLKSRGGTNIAAPIAEALRQIKKNPNTEEGVEYRNLINLVSDGQADRHDPLKLAKTYPEHNAGAFSLGVGTDYDEALMHGIFENAGFGGFAHIPQTGNNQAIDVFGRILPEVISQMMSAPYYPIITFNNWFDSVINMNPSTRNALKDVNSDLHYHRAAIGYQNKGFAVGFIDEDKLDEAKVHLELKESSSEKDPLETTELRIEDFDTLGLDLHDAELLCKAPFEALKMQILKERKPERIREFLENNVDLDGEFRKQLEDLADKLERFIQAGDANALMNVTGNATMCFTNATLGGLLLPAQGAADSNSSGSSQVGRETVQARDPAAYTLVNPGGPPLIRNVAPVQAAPASSGEITLKFTPVNSSVQMVREGVVCSEFPIKPNESLDFGRDPDPNVNDIVLQGSALISKQHGSFVLNEGELSIIDLASSNGIMLNGSKIKPKELVRIRSEDTITIAGNTFRISF